MQYKAIIFDFFGVISSEVAPYWFNKYFSSSESVELKEKYVLPADVGDITEDNLFYNLSKLSDVPAQQIRKDWLQLAHIDGCMVDLIRTLRRKYKIALLSNSPTPFLKEIMDRHKLNNLFDVIVISSEVTCAKPSPKIYSIVLQGLALKPSEVMFIDDNPVNVTAAQEVGIKSFQYINQEKLCRELSDSGIL